MIEARHAWWAEQLFLPYLRRIMTRDFHAVRLMGDMPALRPELPLLVVANHSTWWDGFFIYLLNRELFHRKLHLMMLEEQLRRFPFFSRLGAFGIRQGFPRGVAASLRYSAALLGNPSHALCIFPQGVLAPYRLRPLGFGRAVEHVLRMHRGEVTILPVAVRCELLGERKPMAFLLPGEATMTHAGTFPGTAWLEKREEDLLDRLEAMIARGESGRRILGRTEKTRQ